MDKLAVVVEEKIAAVLPDLFAFVFDGWAHQSTDFVGIFASFPTNANDGFPLQCYT